MTQMRIDADAIAVLGSNMGEVAAALAGITDADTSGSAFAGGQLRGVFNDVIVNWRRERLVLVSALEALSQAAATAGAAYVQVEEHNRSSMGGLTP